MEDEKPESESSEIELENYRMKDEDEGLEDSTSDDDELENFVKKDKGEELEDSSSDDEESENYNKKDEGVGQEDSTSDDEELDNFEKKDKNERLEKTMNDEQGFYGMKDEEKLGNDTKNNERLVNNKKDEDEKVIHFHEMELDARIQKAIAKLGWVIPTAIQEKAIPFLLEGKDIILRARTGSGKTGAFAIPVIQRILTSKSRMHALVLAPSKELCEQIYRDFKLLTKYCSREVVCVDISPQVPLEAMKALLITLPNVVVATPKQAMAHINAGNLMLKNSMDILVIDEADLIFSFGHGDSTMNILRYLPQAYQATLASATLSAEVLKLKSMLLHNPVTLKLNEAVVAPQSQVSHYFLYAGENDKATVLYALLKLELVRGRTIIFVNTVDKCYKLKLYLEQFGIKCSVLNSELPANVRVHTVSHFNRGYYNILIASDEMALEATNKKSGGKGQQQQQTKRRKDSESGVARGIDFQCVSNILNFDFPLDVNSYVHRAGRTARGNNTGTVLSFVNTKEQIQLQAVDLMLKKAYRTNEKIIKPLNFNMEEVQGFRYRSNDAWRAVTRVAVREARLKEIKQEILNSHALKGYFVDNPRDFLHLRHDRTLHTVRLQTHLHDVPDYLVPTSLRKESTREKKESERQKSTRAINNFGRKSNNPLLSFSFTPKGIANNKMTSKMRENDERGERSEAPRSHKCMEGNYEITNEMEEIDDIMDEFDESDNGEEGNDMFGKRVTIRDGKVTKKKDKMKNLKKLKKIRQEKKKRKLNV